MDAASGMMRVTFGKSRVREIRTPGSVRAKAEWLSYSTTIRARLTLALRHQGVSWHNLTRESARCAVVKRFAMKTIRRATELPQSGSVYIFGAGGGGQIIQRIIEKNPMIKIMGFIDNGKSGFINGIRVYKFPDFIEQKTKYDWILIASMYYPEISKQLKEKNICNVVNVYSICQSEAWERRRTIRATITAGVLLLILLMIFGTLAH